MFCHVPRSFHKRYKSRAGNQPIMQASITATDDVIRVGCETRIVEIFAFTRVEGEGLKEGREASVVMQRLSYTTETLLDNKITKNRTVLSF